MSIILYKFLCFNRNIKVDNQPIFFKHFSEKGVNLVSHIMKENGEIRSWNDLKTEFKLEQQLYFKWVQLVNAIPSNWKNNLKHTDTYLQNLILLDHHLGKSNCLFSIEKLELREFYCIINSSRNNKPMSNIF